VYNFNKKNKKQMAKENKSIIESALLDAKRIQEALNANTKEILRSVAIEEINGIVKESLEEEDYEEEDAESVDLDSEVDVDDEMGGEELDLDSEVNVDDEMGGDDIDSVGGDDLEGDYEASMDTDVSDYEDEIDMTTASDDDVIAVYKKLTGDDEIEVVVDDATGDINVSVNEPGEFVIKPGGASEVSMGGELDSEMGDEELDIEMGGEELDIEMGGELDSEMEEDYQLDENEINDEVIYEIELDEMVDIESTKAPVGSEKDNWAGDNLEGGFDEDKTHAKAEGPIVMHEEDEVLEEVVDEDEDSVDENLGHTRGYAGKQGARKVGAAHHPKPKNESEKIRATITEANEKYKALLTEAKELKGKNEEYKTALKQFRNMLAETVVFNSNLTYVTKLFMEHSITKDEKQTILKRFDEGVSTLKESKKLYKTIANELTSRNPISESVDNKINKDITSGVSKQLNESTAYVDRETQRIKELMGRVENR